MAYLRRVGRVALNTATPTHRIQKIQHSYALKERVRAACARRESGHGCEPDRAGAPKIPPEPLSDPPGGRFIAAPGAGRRSRDPSVTSRGGVFRAS